MVAGVSVGVASPALAEPLSGTYTAVIGNGTTTTQTWTFTPCGPDCARVDRVSDGPLPPIEMHLQGTTWSWSDNDPDAQCTASIDSVSLAGSTGCSYMQFPVQLTPAG